ncbi:MAG: hypothetical protein MHM6MM_001945 [Cercozoa sp. M6MM]
MTQTEKARLVRRLRDQLRRTAEQEKEVSQRVSLLAEERAVLCEKAQQLQLQCETGALAKLIESGDSARVLLSEVRLLARARERVKLALQRLDVLLEAQLCVDSISDMLYDSEGEATKQPSVQALTMCTKRCFSLLRQGGVPHLQMLLSDANNQDDNAIVRRLEQMEARVTTKIVEFLKLKVNDPKETQSVLILAALLPLLGLRDFGAQVTALNLRRRAADACARVVAKYTEAADNDDGSSECACIASIFDRCVALCEQTSSHFRGKFGAGSLRFLLQQSQALAYEVVTPLLRRFCQLVDLDTLVSQTDAKVEDGTLEQLAEVSREISRFEAYLRHGRDQAMKEEEATKLAALAHIQEGKEADASALFLLWQQLLSECPNDGFFDGVSRSLRAPVLGAEATVLRSRLHRQLTLSDQSARDHKTDECERELHDLLHRLQSTQVTLEKRFLESRVAMAITMDERARGRLTSTAVDDVFFVVKQSCLRAISTRDAPTACAALNLAIAALDTDLLSWISARLQTALASSDSSYTQLFVSLNNAGVAADHVGTLKTALEQEVTTVFASEKGDKETSMLTHVLDEMALLAPRFHQERSLSLRTFVNKTLRPRIAALNADFGCDLSRVDEAQFVRLCQAGDADFSQEVGASWQEQAHAALAGELAVSFAARVRHALQPTMVSLRRALTACNLEDAVLHVARVVTDGVESRLFGGHWRFSQWGAMVQPSVPACLSYVSVFLVSSCSNNSCAFVAPSSRPLLPRRHAMPSIAYFAAPRCCRYPGLDVSSNFLWRVWGWVGLLLSTQCERPEDARELLQMEQRLHKGQRRLLSSEAATLLAMRVDVQRDDILRVLSD